MSNGEGGKKEREFEIGKDESWFANVKRTYDEYMGLSLDLTRKINAHFDKLMSDAQQWDNGRQAVANQALQSAVETANMVGKQAVRHGDVAIDRQWNLDEVAAWVAKALVQNDAFVSLLAKAIGDAIKKQE